MNKKEINEALTKLEKETKELEIKTSRRDFDNSEAIKAINKKCELLKNYVANDFELTRKYVQSMSYIEHFNFDIIHSNKLKEEAKKKKYKDTSAYMNYHSYHERALEFEEPNLKECCISLDRAVSHDTCFTFAPYREPTIKFSDDVESFTIGDQEIKINRKSDKEKEVYKYEETVEYVVNRPFEFNEDTIISVTNYLNGILNKDAEIEKYENGGID